MLLNCGVEEDSFFFFLNFKIFNSYMRESLGQQGDQTSQSYRKSVLNIHWKD